MRFDPPPSCSVCGLAHFGQCPRSVGFDPLLAIVARDFELASLRALLAAVGSGRLPSASPPPPEVRPAPRRRKAVVPGTSRAAILDLMSDGQPRSSREVAAELPALPFHTASSHLSKLAAQGHLKRVAMRGKNSVVYQQVSALQG